MTTKIENSPAPSTVLENNKRIIVLSNGFVFVGDWVLPADGRPAYATNCFNIRRFGTTAGMGQLALTGPTSETVLDPCGILVPDPGALLFTLICNPMAWE